MMNESRKRWVLLLTLLTIAAAAGRMGFADDADADSAKPAAPLPTDKDLWFNTTPYTWEQLKGKGVCLFFFECGTPGTEEIPKYIQSAKRHALDPIVFIGVSMSRDRLNTEQSLKALNYTLPTVCDPSLNYCRECDETMGFKLGDGIVGHVFVSNYVTPDGKMVEGWWDDPETTIGEALDGASWTTNPKDVPEAVWPLWRAVEFHKYSEALPLFKRTLKSSSEDQKEAAKKLQESVDAEIERWSAEIRTADEADQKWQAYRKATSLLETFRGYEIPKDLDPLQKKLARSPQVKAGLAAEKQFPLLTQNYASPNAGLRKKAQSQLEKIVADFPDSDLASRAKKLLETPKGVPK